MYQAPVGLKYGGLNGGMGQMGGMNNMSGMNGMGQMGQMGMNTVNGGGLAGMAGMGTQGRILTPQGYQGQGVHLPQQDAYGTRRATGTPMRAPVQFL